MSNGTRVVWGDPIGCVYTWVEPRRLVDHAERILRLGRRVGAAHRTLEAAADLPELQFSGATAEGFRVRARHGADRAHEERINLRGVADALDQHAGVLRRYRDNLAELRALAVEGGLEVRDQRIWPPTATFTSTDSTRYTTWVAAWTSYRRCFNGKDDIERERREESRELVHAIVEFTGAHPDLPDNEDGDRNGAPAEDREQQRAYAARALAALDARTALTSAEATLSRLRQAHTESMAALNRLVTSGAPEDAIRAQAAHVGEAAAQLRESRNETAACEQALRQALHHVRGAVPQ